MVIDSILSHYLDIIAAHKLPGGGYSRWSDRGERRPNPYGCADAANMLYTMQCFPTGDDRTTLRDALLGMQDEASGLFHDIPPETGVKPYLHHPMHTTAHCIAALDLFDAKPLYPLTALAPYKTPEGMAKLLDALDWTGNPWSDSHQGAGTFAALCMAEHPGLDWQRAYFQWLIDHTDPVTGISRAGCVPGNVPVRHHINGWFHYMFNMEYAHYPLRWPEKVIDTCLDIVAKDGNAYFGHSMGFAEVDWVFVLNRAMRQTGHRHDEGMAALEAFSEDYIAYLSSAPDESGGTQDLHVLFGVVCALAELQAALPGKVESTYPLRLVLNRRPFI